MAEKDLGMERKRSGWVNVDLTGLRKLLSRRGKEFILYELVQNAWDENSTTVNISLPRPQHGITRLVVTDDSPRGFKDLRHAFTLFAESYKKNNAAQRGAFNAGDKFALAFCEQASIVSTTGGIVFESTGRRITRKRTQRGSEFSGLLKLTTDEWEQMCRAVRRLIPPIETIFNGEAIPTRTPVHTFECVLPTVVADNVGTLRRTSRKTEVRVYEPLADESASLYEMGLPVVATGDKWHIDVQQKVPLNLERDNVTPSYLQAVRVAVLNEMSEHLNATDASSGWVRQAAGDEHVNADTFNKVISMRFGDKRVTYDPSDSEANLIAASKGYVVIGSASLSSEEWENVRRFGSSLPAGRVTPSPKPFSPTGTPLCLLDDRDKDFAINQFEKFAQMLGQELIERSLTVVFANDPGWGFNGCYGGGRLTVNVHPKGCGWFRGTPAELLENWIPFLIHEFAHEKVHGHLTEDYHVECCRLAGVLARRMHEAPALFALCDTRSSQAT
jgi:hypothetical protein